MSLTRNVIVVVCAVIFVAGAAVAAAAEPGLESEGGSGAAEGRLLERAGERLASSIEVYQKLDRMREAYQRLVADAAAVGIELDYATQPDGLDARALAQRTEALRKRLRDARNASTVAGVPRATLDAIASCESGGDPDAVSADGSYRGKYQFDRGTWASIGGSGDPAAAPEAEQDYRAALLYQRSASSPWPVCG